MCSRLGMFVVSVQSAEVFFAYTLTSLHMHTSTRIRTRTRMRSNLHMRMAYDPVEAALRHLILVPRGAKKKTWQAR